VALTEHLRAALVNHMLNCTADFRSDAQRQALGELVRRDIDNAIVLPTGSGKSFLYMLIARMPRLGVTVVILPLVALLHDVVVRCRTEQVPYTT
jgi:superfamily II DNA helicase RecQ